MKFRFAYLLTILFTSLSFAQMSVTTLEGDPIVDGQVFTFDTNVFEDAKIKYVLANSSETETIQVKVEVVSFSNTDGTEFQLCVQPLCFFSVNEGQSYPNSPVVLNPGENNGANDYFANTKAGDGENYPIEYVLRFYMLDDNDNEIGSDLTVIYRFTPETFATQEFELADLGIDLQNTLINQNVFISSSTEAKLELYDVLGKSIQQFEIGIGENTFDLNDISSGIFIAVFTSNDRKKAVTKLVKQ